MSGVNRNILQNGGIPLAGRGQTNIDLVTTSGSRFVIMNFPPTFLSSSNGGSCTGISLQWTPDSTLGFETSSQYLAVTESVLNCEPYSLSPLTSSIGYVQFIDSQYNAAAPTYYMRAYQNFVGGGKGPYSDIVSIQTRANAYCGAPVESVKGGNDSRVVFDVDGWNPNGGIWYSNAGSGSTADFSASFSVTPTLIKNGGPNYDAIATNGATITIPLQGTSIGQGGGYARKMIGQIALVQGNALMTLGGGLNNFNVTATSSTGAGDVSLSLGAGTVPIFPAGINTINKLVGFSFFQNGGFTLDNASIGSGGTINTPVSVTNQVTITTSADCIIRVIVLGTAQDYTQNIYHCKYGPGGS